MESLFYWDSFRELTTCRKYDGAPIPWDSINDYCKRYNIINLHEFDTFLNILRGMDDTYQSHLHRERLLVFY